ncbi:4'-phosphopantetheinyl transferase family protein [Achromobacter sp. NPDC058515]|uniref:4'-phosphopantetheinyl transferase family protein n=1 Tax=Achromobacter sp. NPDC058515 TaxID=3346533 RepID=UPI003647CAFA
MSPDDARRASAIRSPKAADDWRVSRALLHAMRTAVPPPGATSLSHSGGHAVGAAAPAGWKVGVDLERIRPRDVERLAQWVCAASEREALAKLEGAARLDHFYMLWTLKEAFIKAAGLDFPADMASVGLESAPGGQQLRAPPGAWRACSYRLGADWMASVAWLEPAAGPAGPIRPQWRGAAACPLPTLAVLGQWQAGI